MSNVKQILLESQSTEDHEQVSGTTLNLYDDGVSSCLDFAHRLNLSLEASETGSTLSFGEQGRVYGP
jgi:hypothetical protein